MNDLRAVLKYRPCSKNSFKNSFKKRIIFHRSFSQFNVAPWMTPWGKTGEIVNLFHLQRKAMTSLIFCLYILTVSWLRGRGTPDKTSCNARLPLNKISLLYRQLGNYNFLVLWFQLRTSISLHADMTEVSRPLWYSTTINRLFPKTEHIAGQVVGSIRLLWKY